MTILPAVDPTSPTASSEDGCAGARSNTLAVISGRVDARDAGSRTVGDVDREDTMSPGATRCEHSRAAAEELEEEMAPGAK